MAKRKPRELVKCQLCGKEFEVIFGNPKNQKWCSAQCAYNGIKKRTDDSSVEIPCLHCGKARRVPLSSAKRGKGMFCNPGCFQAHRKELQDAKTLNEIRKTTYSINSLKDLIDAKFFKYHEGVLSYKKIRFFACDAHLLYILEEEISKLENGEQILFDNCFNYGKFVREIYGGKNYQKIITDYYPALEFGDIIVWQAEGPRNRPDRRTAQWSCGGPRARRSRLVECSGIGLSGRDRAAGRRDRRSGNSARWA